MYLINGFQLGYLSKSVNIAHILSGIALIKISVLISIVILYLGLFQKYFRSFIICPTVVVTAVAGIMTANEPVLPMVRGLKTLRLGNRS